MKSKHYFPDYKGNRPSSEHSNNDGHKPSRNQGDKEIVSLVVTGLVTVMLGLLPSKSVDSTPKA